MTRKRLTIYISEELNTWLDMVAESQAITKSELLNEILVDVKAGYDADELESIAEEIYSGTNWFMLDEQ